MLQTLIKKIQLEIVDRRQPMLLRTVRGEERIAVRAEVESDRDNHMILGADSVSRWKTKLSSLVRASAYSRVLVGTSAAPSRLPTRHD